MEGNSKKNLRIMPLHFQISSGASAVK